VKLKQQVLWGGKRLKEGGKKTGVLGEPTYSKEKAAKSERERIFGGVKGTRHQT